MKGGQNLETVWFSNRTAEKLADLVKVEMVWNYWTPTRLQARS